jgi:uncharacterized protein YpmS
MDLSNWGFMMKPLSLFNFRSLLPAVTAFAILLTGCGLGPPNVAGPTAPCSVVSSKPAADRLLQRIAAASKTSGATVTVTATSQELTSLLNSFLDQAKATDPTGAFPLENPMICFKNGKMTLYGKINTMGINSAGLITIAAALGNGRANFRVEQVELGPVSVPSGLGDLVSGLINTLVNENLSQIQLTRVEIQNDQISLTGKVR